MAEKFKEENKKKYKFVAVISALLTLSSHISVAKRAYKLINKGKKYVQNGGIAIFNISLIWDNSSSNCFFCFIFSMWDKFFGLFLHTNRNTDIGNAYNHT
jgi:hypothetical protein